MTNSMVQRYPHKSGWTRGHASVSFGIAGPEGPTYTYVVDSNSVGGCFSARDPPILEPIPINLTQGERFGMV